MANNDRPIVRKIRNLLEIRVAEILECDPATLAPIKLGTLVHLIFLFRGSVQDLGGFSSSMSGVLQLVTFEEL